jgi:hypothetical protein
MKTEEERKESTRTKASARSEHRVVIATSPSVRSVNRATFLRFSTLSYVSQLLLRSHRTGLLQSTNFVIYLLVTRLVESNMR